MNQTILTDLEHVAIPAWQSVIDLAYEELKDISELIEIQGQQNIIVPAIKNIFNAYRLTDLENVKVVIFGNYPNISLDSQNEPIDTGIAYERDRALDNIFKELSLSYDIQQINLRSWAKQGVLLVNSALSSNAVEAGSHKNIWLGWHRHVIDSILSINKNVIFVLWGSRLSQIENLIAARSYVLKAASPSAFKGFIGCNHFKTINTILKKHNKTEIIWNL